MGVKVQTEEGAQATGPTEEEGSTKKAGTDHRSAGPSGARGGRVWGAKRTREGIEDWTVFALETRTGTSKPYLRQHGTASNTALKMSTSGPITSGMAILAASNPVGYRGLCNYVKDATSGRGNSRAQYYLETNNFFTASYTLGGQGRFVCSRPNGRASGVCARPEFWQRSSHRLHTRDGHPPSLAPSSWFV